MACRPAGQKRRQGAEIARAAELDGETFLLFSQIGFWQSFCDTRLPHSHFVLQDNTTVFEQFTRTSSPPFFVTDAPAQQVPSPEGRVAVLLRDTSAHAMFYLLVNDGAKPEAQRAFDLLTETR